MACPDRPDDDDLASFERRRKEREAYLRREADHDWGR